MLYTRKPEEPSCAACARGVYWLCLILATDASLQREHNRTRGESGCRHTAPVGVSEWAWRERENMHREIGMAEVNGARIYYEVAGEGEPLVLVHAGIADSRMWEGQVAAFAARYRVVRFDLRGFGKTEMVEGPFSHHEDLRGLLDFLGVERTHLVGCSMGGGAVLDFALEYPERVGDLVLVGS